MRTAGWAVAVVWVLISTAVAQTYAQYNRVLFDADAFPKSVCNDGSPAGFYLEKGEGSGADVFHVHLSGGFWCWDDETCLQRWNYGFLGKVFMSSTRSGKQMRMGGIFSRDSADNPDWYNVNSVIGMYCSSDAWSGDVGADTTGLFAFRGRKNVQAILETLYRDYALGNASYVLVSGCSAGGMGVVANAEFVSDWLSVHVPGAEVKFLVDAGWFLDVPLYPEHGPTAGFNNTVVPQRWQVAVGMRYWRGQVSNACEHHYFDHPWKCYLAQYVLFHQEQFDSWQVSWGLGEEMQDAGPLTWNASKTAYAQSIAEEARVTLADVAAPNGLYSPSCYGHCLLMDASFWNVQLSNDARSLRSVLHDWYWNGVDAHLVDRCGQADCSVNCPPF